MECPDIVLLCPFWPTGLGISVPSPSEPFSLTLDDIGRILGGSSVAFRCIRVFRAGACGISCGSRRTMPPLSPRTLS